MATRKKPVKKILNLPALLQKALPGEPHPSEADLGLMMSACTAIGAVQPWDMMGDSQPYAFDSATGQRWYCIIMGAGGEIFGLQAYRGDAGFALLDDVQHDRVPDSESFIARQDLFTIEFVPRAELSPLDRAMLSLSSHQMVAGVPVPQVTVSRPMHLRWFPNADDVAEINNCLMASLLFFEWLEKFPDLSPWKNRRELPLVTDWLSDVRITQIPFPAPPDTPAPTPAKLDERRLNQLLIATAGRKAGHPVEVDTFALLAPIGTEGRPYFPWSFLACDSSTGFVFAPAMGGKSEKPEDLFLRGVLEALEQSNLRPSAYHVRDEATRRLLDPLGRIFDIPVLVNPLPALDEARRALKAHMH